MKSLNVKEIYLNLQHNNISNIYLFSSIGSTNTWLKENGKINEICIAEKQLLGKGSRGRKWHSPDQNNIYFSIKLSIGVLSDQLSLFPLWIAINLCELLNKKGLIGQGIKWPNDIHWKGRKLAGILLESCHNMTEMVVGIGLNVGMFDADEKEIDQTWCSLSQIMDDPDLIDRNELVAELIVLVKKSYAQVIANDSNFQMLWQQWSLLEGRLVELNDLTASFNQHQNALLKGVVQGVDQYGRLLLKNNETGHVSYYSVGEINILEYTY